MGYQSKTWSLSDEVVAEIEYRIAQMKQTAGVGSPNRVLKDLLFPTEHQPPPPPDRPAPGQVSMSGSPARELLVELDEDTER